MTILGQHTINETRDLIRALQYRITKLDQQAFRNQMNRSGQPSESQLNFMMTLDKDWADFLKAWTTVRDSEVDRMVIASSLQPLVSNDVLPAEASFKAITDVVQSREPHLADLNQRIDKEAVALGFQPTDLSGMPAQDSPDADFAALKKLDKAAAAAGNPLGKPGGTDSVAKSPLGMMLIGGAILAAVGGVLYVKTVL
jgi:hypothetical protein